jgi:hypothetical protein
LCQQGIFQRFVAQLAQQRLAGAQLFGERAAIRAFGEMRFHPRYASGRQIASGISAISVSNFEQLMIASSTGGR